MYKLVLGVAALVLSASTASAQWVYPGYGYAPYGYGYAGLYDYAAPAYGYPVTGGATVIIVTPGSAYAAPPVASGYYNYAPGYGWGALACRVVAGEHRPAKCGLDSSGR
jgi:hypothetical protein